VGRAAVRAALQSYLQDAGIPYLGTVFAARPVIIEEQDYNETLSGMAVAQSPSGSSCVAVVNLPHDKRERRADTGRGAVNDTDIHDIVLELFFASSSGDAIAAQQDYDEVVDALIVAIRANATPGGSAVIWSEGEYAFGVVHDQEEPYSTADGLSILINGVLRMQAWEWIAS
jgi:hypothetical protein